ncbi:MAG: hypothetical protein WDN10_03110 [bacterium]
MVQITTVLSRNTADPRIVCWTRASTIEHFAALLVNDRSVRVEPMTTVKKEMLELPLLIDSGKAVRTFETGPGDMRSFVHLIEILAPYRPELVRDGRWRAAATRAGVPPLELADAAKAALESVADDHLKLVAVALGIVETGELHDAKLRTYTLHEFFGALWKAVAGDGSIDQHLPAVAASG